MLDRSEMRIGEITGMDEVAHTGAVRGWIVVAEQGNDLALADCCLAGDLEQMGPVRRRESGPASGIDASDVEVAQDDVTQPKRSLGVG